MGKTTVLGLVKPTHGINIVEGESGGQSAEAKNLDLIDAAIGALQSSGTTGPAGPQGPAGATGAKGDKGDTGNTGAAGSAGAKGDKGDTGNTGATGPAGAPASAVVASGLMAQFRILPTETPGALVDYSGNGNGATGTVGTAPTIVAGSGGVKFVGNGAISLPAALNSAKTILLFAQFHSNDTPGPAGVPILQSLIQGTDNTFVSGVGKICGITLQGGVGVPIGGLGGRIEGGRRICSFLAQNGIVYANTSLAIFEGLGSVALAQDTQDIFYLNGVAQRNVGTPNGPSAGLQTAGNYQLGGCAAGTGLNVGGIGSTYLYGTVYYALFYNRVLTPQEIAQNHAAMVNELTNRGISVSLGGGTLQNGTPDQNPQVVFRGDSITAGAYIPIFESGLTPIGVAGMLLQFNNLGLSGDHLDSLILPTAPAEVDSLYRPGAPANLAFEWEGWNDGWAGALSKSGYARQWCADRRRVGWKTFCGTITGSLGESSYNDYLRREWASFCDALVDIAACPNLGATNSQNDTAYFADTVHPTGLSNQFLIAPLFTRMIDRTLGRNSYSAALTQSVNSGPAKVQAYHNYDAGHTGTSGSLQVNSGAGNLLILEFDPGGTGYVTSVTDSNHNVWTCVDWSNYNTLWYCYNCKSGLNLISFTCTNTYTDRWMFAEYSGVAGAPYAFFAKASSGSNGTALDSGAITTTVPNSLILGIGVNSTSAGANFYTAGAGFTMDANNYYGGVAFIESQVLASPGVIHATATAGSSCQWDMMILAFSPDPRTTYAMQDQDVYLKADPANGSIAIRLYPATGITGSRARIKNLQTSGGNTVTVVPKSIAIQSVVANGSTAVFTVRDVTPLIVGQTILPSGCTTSGLNVSAVITAISHGSGSAGTVTVASAVTVTETEPAGAQLICEFIDGAASAVIPNNGELVLESVLNPNPAIGGCSWVSARD